MELDRSEWVAPPHLDKVVVAVEFPRDRPGVDYEVRITGTSRKRSSPLWSWSLEEGDARNLAPLLAGILGAVEFYRPTDEDKLLRACMGGRSDGPDPNQGTLPGT